MSAPDSPWMSQGSGGGWRKGGGSAVEERESTLLQGGGGGVRVEQCRRDPNSPGGAVAEDYFVGRPAEATACVVGSTNSNICNL